MTPVDVQTIVRFALGVPSDVNPYSAVARHLIALLTPPPPAPWVHHLEHAIIFGYVIIFLQSCFILHLVIKTRSYSRFGIAEFNLFQIDSLSVMGICYAIYAALVITDFSLSKYISAGNLAVGTWIIIHGSKFTLMHFTGLAFLWICVCQCVSLTWRSGTQGPSFGKQSMPKIVPWIMHLILIILLILIPPFIIWQFVSAAAQYNYVKDRVIAVSGRLLQSAASYSPETYQQYKLLLVLVPLENVPGHVNSMSSSLLTGMKMYLILAAIAISAYIPSISFAFRKLYKQYSASEHHFSEKLVISEGEEIESLRIISERTRKIRTWIVYRVGTALVAYLVHIPAMVWMIVFAQDWYFLNPDWLVASHLGLHGPHAIVGNICMFLLIRSVLMAIPSSDEETGDDSMTSTSKNRTRFHFCNFLIKSKTQTPSTAKDQHVNGSGRTGLGIQDASHHNESAEASRESMIQRQFCNTSRLDDHRLKMEEVTDLSTISDGQSARLSAKSTAILQFEPDFTNHVANITTIQ